PIGDRGLVGDPARVNPQVLKALEGAGIVPVIAPIGFGESGETFNVTADTVAGATAAAVKAARLLMLTDVMGVLDKEKQLIAALSLDEVRRLMADGTISGGMIPKLETCVAAVEGGVEAA